MSGWLPKSRKARRRLVVLSAVAPVLALAVGLTLWGLSDSISYFYTPAQAAETKPEPGRTIQLGGLVQGGSVVKHPDGRLEFVVADQITAAPVVFQGDPPDLFREGQGVVATGAFREDGVFEARRLLAKHDETYMPRDLQNALKEQGEWRADGAPRVPDAQDPAGAPYGGAAGR
ncbi:MAG: cytochrome c maturation protein CcmE [Phenylobacterium sp.]|uniref:cytochrome c maturation protein CcmE n=1 Tax=Phenylobacterium sp. TaxID=1871053 RepID=UPI00273456F9|nr:cytochrome c maturation protein CcmE [Phenylobacterium sp.]MDP1643398.1 cytochrome c maturation protein CcmE [Phenylobacterium sp.]MDP3116788.1 cytochrome c maturation protein CcmE [Phenylobacterium sp.]MDP3384088.1 cytochrome c maturation protein CcmE [Phenylobacterium sp.]